MSISREDLITYLSLLYGGNYDKMIEHIYKRKKLPISFEEAVQQVIRTKCNVIVVTDYNYPNSFKVIKKPPLIVYTRGDFSLLNQEYDASRISILGDNINNEELEIIKSLNNYIILVVPVTINTKPEFLEALINSGKKIVAVLENSINEYQTNPLLKRIVEKDGLVISEIPPQHCSDVEGEISEIGRIIGALGHIDLIVSPIRGNTITEEAIAIAKNSHHLLSFKFNGYERYIEEEILVHSKEEIEQLVYIKNR